MELIARWLAAAVVLLSSAGLGGCSAVSPESAGGCVPGPLIVTPAAVQPGERLTVSARASSCSIRFTDDRWYRLELAYSRWDVTATARVRAAPDGAFTTSIEVPAGAPPGRPIVAITSGYSSPCPAAASCAGAIAQPTVVRPEYSPPDRRTQQARLDAADSQRGRLTMGGGPGLTCLTLDRAWTTNVDLALPAGWRYTDGQILDDTGRTLARLGDDVRVVVTALQQHSHLNGCKQDRTTATIRSISVVRGEGPPPPGGRLLVGTDTSLTRPTDQLTDRTGTLRAARHRDYLCVTLTVTDGRSIPLAFPPGTTALPDGTLLDERGETLAGAGTQVTTVTATAPTATPVGCPTARSGLGVLRLTRAD